MAKPWAISGVDLHVDLTSGRLRAGLEDALRDAIRSNRLPPATRLPSSRQLAADLDVARNTVAEAYGQLVAEGWLVARQGSGTRVAPRPTSAARPPAPALVKPPQYDLRAGFPTLSRFPATAWVAALRHALLVAPHDALGSVDPRGRPELRAALAGYLTRARGVTAAPDSILVCSGFSHGLALIADVLRDRGGTSMAVEAYGQQAHHQIVTARGLSPRPLPVDAQGARTDHLTGEDAVLLTPAHQFPLGPALSPERRAAAVAWASAANALVVEDDYDGEFRYDRQPVGALQGLAPDNVAYLGTASKTLAPGLRLGWIVAPSAWIDDLATANASTGSCTSSLDQLALAQLITTGGYDRHIRRSRLAYRRRRDQLAKILHDHSPPLRPMGISAGLHAVVPLPDHLDESAVVSAATQQALALEGLADYHLGTPPHPPALVIGYATPPDHSYSGALDRLLAALRTAA